MYCHLTHKLYVLIFYTCVELATTSLFRPRERYWWWWWWWWCRNLTGSPNASSRTGSARVDPFTPLAKQVLNYFALGTVDGAVDFIFLLRRETALYSNKNTDVCLTFHIHLQSEKCKNCWNWWRFDTVIVKYRQWMHQTDTARLWKHSVSACYCTTTAGLCLTDNVRWKQHITSLN